MPLTRSRVKPCARSSSNRSSCSPLRLATTGARIISLVSAGSASAEQQAAHALPAAGLAPAERVAGDEARLLRQRLAEFEQLRLVEADLLVGVEQAQFGLAVLAHGATPEPATQEVEVRGQRVQGGMEERAFNHRCRARLPIFLKQVIFERASIDANADGAAVGLGRAHHFGHAVAAADIAGVDAQARRPRVRRLQRALVVEVDVGDDRHARRAHDAGNRDVGRGRNRIGVNGGDGFDLQGLRAFLVRELPNYARPIFIRIQPAIETTGTFKYRKVDLVRDGFDPSKTEQTPYVLHPGERRYLPITPALYEQIQSGALKF